MRRPSRSSLPLLLAALQAAACTTANKAPPTAGPSKPARVALLPLKAVGVPPAIADRARRAIAEELARGGTREVLPLEAVDRAKEATPACQQPDAERPDGCAVDAGRKLGASLVLVAALGGLGKTCIVQMRVLDPAKQTVTRSLEETRFGDPAKLPKVAGQLALRLFPSAAKVEHKAWYTRWWIWAAVAAAATAGVVIPLAATSGKDDPFEEVPLP